MATSEGIDVALSEWLMLLLLKEQMSIPATSEGIDVALPEWIDAATSEGTDERTGYVWRNRCGFAWMNNAATSEGTG